MIIKGVVTKGRGIGKKFGIPTANIELNKDYQMPEQGVFAGLIIIKYKKYKAAIFIGPRLTFNLKEPVIEIAIIDFNDDLYDKEVELEIGEKIREVERFGSVEELKGQILDDIEHIKASQKLKVKSQK